MKHENRENYSASKWQMYYDRITSVCNMGWIHIDTVLIYNLKYSDNRQPFTDTSIIYLFCHKRSRWKPYIEVYFVTQSRQQLYPSNRVLSYDTIPFSNY